MRNYIQFGKYVVVTEELPDPTYRSGKLAAYVNWSCIGEQPLEVVEEFRRNLDLAIERAKGFEKRIQSEAVIERPFKKGDRVAINFDADEVLEGRYLTADKDYPYLHHIEIGRKKEIYYRRTKEIKLLKKENGR